MDDRIAKLALSDGTVFTGKGFGAPGEVYGEVVFNTSMTGYQEILTDPSYCGQIVTMTYPLIGNYGANSVDVESGRLALRGFVVRELCRHPSNQRLDWSLEEYLSENGVIGIEGIDTRALVRRIRIHGAMTGVLSSTDTDDASLVKKAQSSPELVGQDLVKEVIPQEAAEWSESLDGLVQAAVTPGYEGLHGTASDPSEGPHVVAIDYGMKWNIPRHLRQLGCRVTVVPGTATSEEVLSHEPDGVFLSNGPGDPSALGYAIENVKMLADHGLPIFGICMGHQILGQALGAKTFKLKFGHRGANQPVKDLESGRIEITSQNHGFAVADPDKGMLAQHPSGYCSDPQENIIGAEVKVRFINANDQTVEGLDVVGKPAFSIQYHPEACPGPHDASYLFDRFSEIVADHLRGDS